VSNNTIVRVVLNNRKLPRVRYARDFFDSYNRFVDDRGGRESLFRMKAM